MTFENSDVREAYKRGARDSFASVLDRLPGPTLREMEAWLEDLDAWKSGDPPPAPYDWASLFR